MAISARRLQELQRLLQAGREDLFYHWPEWKALRGEVLRLDRWECQRCKAKGRHSAARIVHHVSRLRDRPDLALSVFDGEARQLVSVCKRCHEELHPESRRHARSPCPPVTGERWE